MRHQSLKMALVGGAVALIVMFGIDTATSGIERVNGPMNQTGALAVNPAASYEQTGSTYESALTTNPGSEQLNGNQALPQSPQAVPSIGQRVGDAQHGRRSKDGWQLQMVPNVQADPNERLPGLPDLRTDSSVNQLADGTAGVLQSISSKGIRFIVSFFESVTD